MRFPVLGLLVACGGGSSTTAPVKPVVSAPTTCTPRWLTLDHDVIDLEIGPDRVVWLENERGRIVAFPRSGGPEIELRPAATTDVDASDLALAGDRIVWVDKGGLQTLGPDGATRKLSPLAGIEAIATTRDLVVAATQEGVYGVSFAGDEQRLHGRYGWVMALDDKAAYAQVNTLDGKPNAAILRLPLDGSESSIAVPEERPVLSLLAHGGRVLFTLSDGVYEIAGGAKREVAFLGAWSSPRNLRAAGDRVYFNRGNVIYELRGKQPVPVAIVHENVRDFEIDGTTFYVVADEYKGVRVYCIEPNAPAVAFVTPETVTCLPGETREVTQYGAIECLDDKRDRLYSLGFHDNGTKFEEYSRDNGERTWYADGTLRTEKPWKGAGVEKRFYPTGQVHEEGRLDDAGEYHGTWKEYGPDGAVRATIEWNHGKR